MKAFLKNYRQSPRKVRLVADIIRGKKTDHALTLLSTGNKRATSSVKKLIESAIANAKKNFGINTDNLIIKDIQVNEGIVFKRYQPRARGRAFPIRKKTSHISITLLEKLKMQNVKRKVQSSNTKFKVKTKK